VIITTTKIAGAVVITTTAQIDERGSFSRLFCDRKLAPILGDKTIVQINQSMTLNTGTIRGLHYQQPPHAEMKLVRCLSGKVWDVCVDLRTNSPTFLQWHAEELSADDNKMFVIPEGCAHGFQTLEDNSTLLYLHTTAYAPEAEAGVTCNDPRLAITWPLAVSELSPRDRALLALAADFKGIPS
jgi:dTDP-4-dehydrorhamnose 3,5-epimerase